MQATNTDTKDDWASRIARLKREKEDTENIEYGVKITTLVNDFFISEYVIPNQNKIYQNGKLQKFNFKGLNISDLIVKEIFRRKHFTTNYVETDIRYIKQRMFALFNILKFIPNKEDKQENYSYKSALLGAIGSLFTALEQNPVFADVLNNQFKKQFRNMVFHFGHLVLEREPFARLKLVFTHFYEHCRSELVAHYHFPSSVWNYFALKANLMLVRQQ